jgi:hypothetical protein
MKTTRFMMKKGITFTPDGANYDVVDEDTQSRFRIGEVEYQLLKQFEGAADIKEVGYHFRTNTGFEVPPETMHKFIEQAIRLNILEAQSESLWSRIGPSTAFTFSIKLFDPTRLLDFLISKARSRFNPYSATLAAAVLLLASIILVRNWSAIWAFRSFSFPEHFGAAITVVIFFALGHELAHGLVGKWYGFDVSAVGFHLHYFMPSFYCKMFRRTSASKKSILMVLLGGSLFDLMLMGLLLFVWWFSPDGSLLRAWISVAVSMMLIKVLLIQLNPLWPYSDGYRILGVLFFQKKGVGSE